MATFRYLSPHRMFARGGSVAGSVDARYQAAWLVDGRTDWPVRKTGTSISLAITGTAQDVDLLVLGHHNLVAAATVNITGDITNTIPLSAMPPNDIPLNGHRLLGSPVVGADALTVAVTGQTAGAVIIGEFAAGLSSTLPVTLMRDTEFSVNDFSRQRPVELASMPPNDRGMEGLRWRGTGLFTAAQLAEALAWQQAQRGSSRPSVIIEPLFGTARFVYFRGLTRVVPKGPELFDVELVFDELPRKRW